MRVIAVDVLVHGGFLSVSEEQPGHGELIEKMLFGVEQRRSRLGASTFGDESSQCRCTWAEDVVAVSGLATSREEMRSALVL